MLFNDVYFGRIPQLAPPRQPRGAGGCAQLLPHTSDLTRRAPYRERKVPYLSPGYDVVSVQPSGFKYEGSGPGLAAFSSISYTTRGPTTAGTKGKYLMLQITVLAQVRGKWGICIYIINYPC